MLESLRFFEDRTKTASYIDQRQASKTQVVSLSLKSNLKKDGY